LKSELSVEQDLLDQERKLVTTLCEKLMKLRLPSKLGDFLTMGSDCLFSMESVQYSQIFT